PVLLACVQPCRRAHRILVPHLLSFPFPLARPPPTSPLFPYTTLFRSIQTTAEITKWYMVHTRNRTCFHFFIFAHINHMQGVTLFPLLCYSCCCNFRHCYNLYYIWNCFL